MNSTINDPADDTCPSRSIGAIHRSRPQAHTDTQPEITTNIRWQSETLKKLGTIKNKSLETYIPANQRLPNISSTSASSLKFGISSAVGNCRVFGRSLPTKSIFRTYVASINRGSITPPTTTGIVSGCSERFPCTCTH